MKSVLNKLTRPIKVPLPRGRTLHLGPKQTGQIAVHAVDHEPLQRLVKEGALEILDDNDERHVEHGGGASGHPETHGFHHRESHNRGDR